MPVRVALIVDNPLRDLDGLVLLAWQLARRGAVAYLVPMYRQGFDVPALRPDVVVANYVRPNNRDLLLLYRSLGIRVAVLDTEGVAGKNAAQFATMVAPMGARAYVDLYCVWGEDQYAAFREAGIVEPNRLRLTGCPRFDYCAPPWRDALPRIADPGFVLVNTNFPTVNPRFSTGVGHELRSMIAAGFDEAFSRRFIDDARRAQAGMIEAVGGVAERFPSVRFVVRPHPFERPDPYVAIGRPNVQTRQEGSVLEWLAASRVLVHQNCSTAVEAVMMGVEPLSCEWLNTPTLHLEGPTSVSRAMTSPEHLAETLGAIEAGREPRDDPASEAALAERRAGFLARHYYRVDGQSAARVADALLECAAGAPVAAAAPARALRSVAVGAVRNVIGFGGGELIRRTLGRAGRAKAVAAKAFARDPVDATLARLDAAAGAASRVTAQVPDRDDLVRGRLASGESLRIAG